MNVEFMIYALNLAREAYKCGEIPVGAVVVCGDKIVGRGYNCCEKHGNPTMHAEMIAISDACRNIGSKFLVFRKQ